MTGEQSHYLLFEFACGHVGRDNESDRSKTKTFIRVAERRGAVVAPAGRNCPDCSKGGGA